MFGIGKTSKGKAGKEEKKAGEPAVDSAEENMNLGAGQDDDSAEDPDTSSSGGEIPKSMEEVREALDRAKNIEDPKERLKAMKSAQRVGMQMRKQAADAVPKTEHVHPKEPKVGIIILQDGKHLKAGKMDVHGAMANILINKGVAKLDPDFVPTLKSEPKQEKGSKKKK